MLGVGEVKGERLGEFLEWGEGCILMLYPVALSSGVSSVWRFV